MPRQKAARLARDRVIRAAGEFARLTDALDRNDFALAAEAHAALARLGFTVRVRVGDEAPDASPVLLPIQPRHEAAGQEGTHGA